MISIIVPVYNLEKYIAACLDSILAQTYQDFEIIVVDDGSTDASPEIIRQYSFKDKRVKPIFKNNGGVTDARFCGIKNSIGEWIGFVDGDDEIEPYMYELLINNAINYNADISHCGFQMCFSDGRVSYINNSKILLDQNNERGIVDLIEGVKIEPALWNKIYKRELFDDIESLIPKGIRINEDLLMNYYL